MVMTAVVLLEASTLSTGQLVEELLDAEQMGSAISQMVKTHIPLCYLVFLSTQPNSPILSTVRRSLANSVMMDDSASPDQLSQALQGDSSTTCRALVLHIGNSDTTGPVLGLLEQAGMSKLSEMWVWTVGNNNSVEAVLLHPSFRNTVRIFYLALPDKSDNSNLTLDQDQFQDFQGHTLRIVACSWFPFIDFSNGSGSPGSTITLRDSLDARTLNVLSSKLNFTYLIHAEPTGSWGIEREGKFSGMMGQLQREESDVSTSAGPTPERNKYLEPIRAYPADPMKLVSLKPSPLPHSMALVRPFSGEVWVSVAVGVAVWGVTLWMLQLAWGRVTGQRGASFISVFLYGWGALLEQPPREPSVTVSGQMLVGWWLVYTMVIVAAFRSSFIAHLTVQSTTKPVETLEELIRDADDALEKILEGGYTHITFEKYISVIIASQYTDAQGRTPYYIGTKDIPVLVYAGFVLRKGAPFYHRFTRMINQLEDGGILSKWIAEVVTRRIKKNREKLNNSQQGTKTIAPQPLEQCIRNHQELLFLSNTGIAEWLALTQKVNSLKEALRGCP
ncbi:hypothetical protein O3P69_020168 [Scylla paramamosain]|uniref:Ionotropic glutamate receptor C-terminal domain-containing protein n=1 Tax=Scylla paramamosain TaxID=85552 RepID=A0AAW0TL45_SCYPA